MKKIPLNNATMDELRYHAVSVLGIEEADGVTARAKMLALIGPAWTQDWIHGPDDEDEEGEQATPVAAKVFTTGRDDGPPTTFKIGQTEGPGGKHAAHPSVNGRMLVMQRNMTLTAPYAYYLALKDAVVGVSTQGPDRDGRPGDIIVTDVTNYPLSEVQMPPQAEIDAWHARNGPRLLAA